MPYVVSFEDFKPGERYDGLPWTQVRIEESANGTSGWTALETKPLSPVDSDPANPQARDVTTALATLATGFYRLILIDAAGATQATAAIAWTAPPTVTLGSSAVPLVSDEAAVRTRLGSMVASASDPALTSDELDDLVRIARRADPYGAEPTDDDWQGSWDLNAAAAEGWRWKAAKVAGEYRFATDGNSFDRQQKHEACLAMADKYARGVVASIPIVTDLSLDPDYFDRVSA